MATPLYVTISHFRVDKNDKLGRGSHGNVYRAFDIHTNQPVAAKEVYLGSDDEDIARTKREVDAMEKIPDHPNIIGYLGHSTEGEDLWIFMELCEQKDLDIFCEKQSLNVKEKFDIMIQIASGIKHFHDIKVAHRDIKPANVLVTFEDGKVMVKLGDFSVAKIGDVNKKFNTIVGTREFWAPELFDLEDHPFESYEVTYDISVDIFGAALIFYDLMICDKRKLQPPYIKGKPVGLAQYLSKSRGGLTTSPIKFNIDDSRWMKMMKTMISSMISFNPAERPAIDAVLDELKSIRAMLGESKQSPVRPMKGNLDGSPLNVLISGIQGIVAIPSTSKERAVSCDYIFESLDEDDDIEDRPLVSLKTKGDLLAYDSCKLLLGIEDAAELCHRITDSDGNNIELFQSEDDSSLVGTIVCSVIVKGTVEVLNDTVKFRNASSDHLTKIQDVLKKSETSCKSLVRDFCRAFCTHYVSGKFEMGGAFEWVIISNEPGLKKFKSINKDLQKAIKQSKGSLLGSSEGKWYPAIDLLGKSKHSEEDLMNVQVRVTKYAGSESPETYAEWSESVLENDLNLIPISHEDEALVIPVYNVQPICKDDTLKTLIRTVVQKKEAPKKQKLTLTKSMSFIRHTREDILQMLALSDYYPRKIALKDVMSLSFMPDEECQWNKLAWVMLEKIVMLDSSARDADIAACDRKRPKSAAELSLDDLVTNVMSTEGTGKSLHPLDVFIIVFQCCNPFLQQLLVKKLYMCRLAIPFLIPAEGKSIICSLWPLEGILLEWKDKDNMTREEILARYSMPIVAFLRAGRPSVSKSKLLNEMLMSQNTFCCKDCPSGSNVRSIADGFVEISQFLPSGKESSSFDQEILFMNLRGNCMDLPTQSKAMLEVASTVVMIVDIDELPMLEDVIKEAIKENIILILTCDSSPKESVLKMGLKSCQSIIQGKIDMKDVVIGLKEGRPKTLIELKQDLMQELNNVLAHQSTDGFLSLQAHARALSDNYDIQIDEEILKECRDGKDMAERVVATIKRASNDSKQKLLPLQGDLWQTWGNLQKKLYRAKENELQSLQEAKVDYEEQMYQVRSDQQMLSRQLTPLISSFRSQLGTGKSITKTILFFLNWLRIELDSISRSKLPMLHNQFQETWDRHNSLKMSSSDSEELAALQTKMGLLQREIANTTIGLEHILRELGQLYEADHSAIESSAWSFLPSFTAQLLLHGFPFELMDGDAGTVPITWVRAVLSSLEAKIKNRKVFIISVLGIQSSGKSTLLNTMFGLEFAVSAGRCTRGIYAQIIPVKKGSGLPFDYLMILDSEGLRAPELGVEKYHHDNELASFITGLADLTFINVKGENTTEIEDILQIVVQAFLRMKIVISTKKQRCIFIHQNVSAVNAGDKMKQGLNRLQENLDALTQEAAQAEKIGHENFMFSQIIEFRGQDDVYYLPDLFNGSPPMASINSAYSRKIKELKTDVLKRILQDQPEILSLRDFTTRIRDMWDAILSDDFVFSFRNSIATKAHLQLERVVSELKFEFEQHMLDIGRALTAKITKCDTLDMLTVESTASMLAIEQEVRSELDATVEKLKDYFETTEYKEVLCDHKQQKISCMKNAATLLKQKMEQEIKVLQTQQHTALMYMSHKKDHKEKIMQKAMDLARELKGKKLTDTDIEKEFEVMWTESVEPAPDEITVSVIQSRMEDQLLRQLRDEGHSIDSILPFLRGKIKSRDLKKGITIHDVTDSHFSLKKTGMVQKAVNLLKRDTKQQIPHVVEQINDILEGLNIFLEAMSEDRKKFYVYSRNFVRSTLNCFQAFIDKPLENQPFVITATAKAELSAHVVCCATSKFTSEFSTGLDTSGTTEIDIIRQTLQSVLLHEFEVVGQHKHVEKYLTSYLHTKDLNPRPVLAGSVSEKEMHHRLISLKDTTGQVANYYSKAAKVINAILQVVDSELDVIRAEDAKFAQTHGSRLLRKIMTTFDNFNKRKASNLMFTWECQAKYAVIAMRHAIPKFESMNIRHELKYGGKSKLEQYKSQIRIYFFHQVQESETNETATLMLCHTLSRSIYDVVMQQLADEITNSGLINIGFAKHDLIIAILTDLAEQRDFYAYVQYINNGHAYATKWLRKYTLHLAFKDKDSPSGSLFAKFANIYVDKAAECIRKAVGIALTDAEAQTSIESKRVEWTRTFYREASKELYLLPSSDLNIIEGLQVTDLKRLGELLLNRLSEIIAALKRNFKCMSEHTVWWEDDAPETRMLKILWGCKEQCHFCGEPCKKTDPDHKEPHQCVQHRPNGAVGVNWHNTKTLSVLVCTAAVASNEIYFCKNDQCPMRKEPNQELKHKYKDYKECLPRWDMAPDNSGRGSVYWKWFMRKFKQELLDYYEMENSDIPKRWSKIHSKEALESLNEYKK